MLPKLKQLYLKKTNNIDNSKKSTKYQKDTIETNSIKTEQNYDGI